jgi:hypothetical protein
MTTSADTTPVGRPFTVTASTAIKQLVATMNNTTPGADQVDYRATFRVTGSLNGPPSPGAAGYVQLTGPPGSSFDASGSYTVTDGLRSLPAGLVVTDPVPPGDQLGLGANVVDVYVPFEINTGDTITVDTSAMNAKKADAVRSFSAATSSDATPVAALLGLQPTLNRTVGVTPTRGVVTVKEPGKRGFVALRRGEIIKVGSTVDAARGSADVKAALNVRGTSNSIGRFYGGAFGVGQTTLPAPKHKRRVFTVLTLGGVTAVACAARIASAPPRRRKRRRTQVSLWGSATGDFQTVGSDASATELGTTWFMEDTCAGTLIHVTQGAVKVDDFSHHRVFVLKAPGEFLAHPGPGG